MRESVLSYVLKCPTCKASYIEVIGETCKCPSPMYEEEPVVKNWESLEVNCNEADA